MIEKYQLRNGLTVLLVESHRAPVVSVQMWVKTGSADEKKGEEGISHFIEHLVFKGSRSFKAGEIASVVEGSGGELNAYTSLDQTVFYVTISREFASVALKVVSEMMGYPTFDTQEIDSEREVVCEEIKRTNDSPNRQASALLFSTLYKKHPYGIPIIGYEKNIREFPTQKIVDFYKSRYVPRNMTLLVVGDFQKKEMKGAVEDLFGPFQDLPIKNVDRPAEPPQSEFRVQTKQAMFEEANLNMAWRIPGAHHDDVPALDALAIILGQGDSSRLARRLRLEKPLTNYISAFSYTPKDEGFFSVGAGLNPAKLPEVLDVLGEELLLIQAEPPTAEELGRAVTALESDELYGMETVDGISQKIGSFENLFGDPNYYKKYLEQINKLTPESIHKAARKYLTKNATVTFMAAGKPQTSESILEKWCQDFEMARAALETLPESRAAAKSSAKPLKWNPEGAKAEAPEKVDLECGASLILRRDPEVPSFSIQAGFRGGTRVEKPDLGGTAELMTGLWTAGTHRLSEMDILGTAERLATGISAISGRNSSSLRMDSLSPFASEALEIFFDVLNDPIFPAEILDRERTVLTERIRARMDNPGQVATILFMLEMFGHHPYGRSTEGTLDSVKKIKRSDLVDFWKTIHNTSNLVIAICGDFEKKSMIDRVERALEKMPRGNRIADRFEIPALTSDRIKHVDLKKEQTNIMLGYRGLTVNHPDRYVAQVIESILSGQGGRLFLNLRDKHSLAYSVGPIRLEGIETGFFGAYIGCSPEKAETAVKMLTEEFHRLTEETVDGAELERSIRYLVGSHDIELQKNSGIGFKMLLDDLYGLKFNEIFQYAEILRKVTADDIKRVSRNLFLHPKVVVSVGSRKPKL